VTPNQVSPRLSPHVKRELCPETSLAHADASPEDRSPLKTERIPPALGFQAQVVRKLPLNANSGRASANRRIADQVWPVAQGRLWSMSRHWEVGSYDCSTQ